jgi:hypothetical protein
MSENEAETTTAHNALRAIGWVSIGFGLAAVGVFVGHELRKRYKFNHRTPYDFYANAEAASDFGMGV